MATGQALAVAACRPWPHRCRYQSPQGPCTLIKLTERYCVVYRTLANPVQMSTSVTVTAP